MKYIKIKSIAAILLLLYSLTGCSYVSDYVEGRITTRASFSIKAEISEDDVILSWSETDSSDDFAGIEIYRSKYENDEYAPYFRINSGNITTNPGTYTDSNALILLNPNPGVYFYRVGFIHWDEEDSTDYDSETHISKISGYAKVIIQ